MKSITHTVLICFLLLGQNFLAQDGHTFELCPDLKSFPYYNFDELNEKSFQEIKEYFRADYDTDKMTLLQKNSGIVTVRFAINCKGETGYFKAFSCDLDYVLTEISPEISDFFFEKVKQLNGWKPTVHEEVGACNAHKFYSFRIVNGELTEILPR